MKIRLSLLLALAWAAGHARAADDRPVAEKYLLSGDLSGGEKVLLETLRAKPDDDQVRFGLGTIQFVKSVEHLMQGFYHFGLSPDIAGGQIPFLRLPVAQNPAPHEITYADLRGIFERLLLDLSTAEKTLAGIKDDGVKLPIRLALVRLDFDGDGRATEDESFWKIYGRMNGQVGRNPEIGQATNGFDIAFDRGDVAWLRGYTHLLSTLAEVYLAHDGKALFDQSAHLFFARPKLAFPFLAHKPLGDRRMDAAWIADLVAFVHMMRLPVKEPRRMESALSHMKAVIALSRESWKFYMAETDNDREWVPNPKQTTSVPGGTVTEEMVMGWKDFLDEAEKILDGKVLIPFWRDADGKGINLKRVFTEPRDLDPVLWFQGTAAMPYLEDGKVTPAATWQRLQRIFRGEFIGFAIWFN